MTLVRRVVRDARIDFSARLKSYQSSFLSSEKMAIFNRMAFSAFFLFPSTRIRMFAGRHALIINNRYCCSFSHDVAYQQFGHSEFRFAKDLHESYYACARVFNEGDLANGNIFFSFSVYLCLKHPRTLASHAYLPVCKIDSNHLAKPSRICNCMHHCIISYRLRKSRSRSKSNGAASHWLS